LEQKLIKAPIDPKVKSEYDIKNFDKKILSQSLASTLLSPTNNNSMLK